MKQILITSFVLILLTITTFAQDVERKGYIGISLGSSTPTGEFAKKDFNSSSLNFASGGAVFDITFAYKLGKRLGIAALLRGQSNQLNNKAIIDQLELENPGMQFSIKSENWSLGGLLIGGYGCFPLTQNGKLNFEAKVLFGFASATCPKFTIYNGPIGSSSYVVSEEIEANDLAGFISIGLNYRVGRKITLLMNLDTWEAGPSFKNGLVHSSNGDTFENSFNQKMTTVNFTVGAAYMLR